MWGVYCDVDSHELLQQSYNELRRLLELLEAFPEMRIELRGHTDNTGTRNHNQQLSDDRAKSVADYLAEHGVERRRMTSIGFGGTLPVDNNDTPEGRARNRRVEYRVVGY
jgi:outer membrane protein OmpA-like peptidoglycan-associated protein